MDDKPKRQSAKIKKPLQSGKKLLELILLL